MLVTLIMKSLFLGVIISAPVGPVGALVIRRTLRVGMALGLSTGIGAALADATFAFLAIFGIAQIHEFLKRNDVRIALGGGILLLIFGIFSMIKDLRKRRDAIKRDEIMPADWLELERKAKKAQKSNPSSYLKAALGSLLITFSNPVTIVGFAGAFAAFGLLDHSEVNVVTHSIVIGAVFLGALTWWTSLALFIRWMRGRLSNSSILNIQLFTHGLIILSGLLCFIRGFIKIV